VREGEVSREGNFRAHALRMAVSCVGARHDFSPQAPDTETEARGADWTHDRPHPPRPAR
jgi:hypothetical protein